MLGCFLTSTTDSVKLDSVFLLSSCSTYTFADVTNGTNIFMKMSVFP